MKFGQLQITNDINYVINNSNNYTIMCFSVETQNNVQFMQAIDPINAIILTPPYEVVMSPDINSYTSAYYNYLSNDKDAAEMIALMLKAISLGKNILLYLTPDESQLEYSNIFIQYMYSIFGIAIGNEYRPSSIEPKMIFRAFEHMYLFNLIESSDILDIWFVLKTLPQPSQNTIYKLANDIKPFGQFNTLDDYYEYFKRLCCSDNNVRLEVAIQQVM